MYKLMYNFEKIQKWNSLWCQYAHLLVLRCYSSIQNYGAHKKLKLKLI